MQSTQSATCTSPHTPRSTSHLVSGNLDPDCTGCQLRFQLGANFGISDCTVGGGHLTAQRVRGSARHPLSSWSLGTEGTLCAGQIRGLLAQWGTGSEPTLQWPMAAPAAQSPQAMAPRSPWAACHPCWRFPAGSPLSSSSRPAAAWQPRALCGQWGSEGLRS